MRGYKMASLTPFKIPMDEVDKNDLRGENQTSLAGTATYNITSRKITTHLGLQPNIL